MNPPGVRNNSKFFSEQFAEVLLVAGIEIHPIHVINARQSIE